MYYHILMLDSSHASRKVTKHYEGYIRHSQRLGKSQVSLGQLENRRIHLAKKLAKYQKALEQSVSAPPGLHRQI